MEAMPSVKARDQYDLNRKAASLDDSPTDEINPF